MELEKHYRRTRFAVEVIREAAITLFTGLDGRVTNSKLEVHVEEGTWQHDTEDEFFADYRRSLGSSVYWKVIAGHSLHVQSLRDSVFVQIEAPSRAPIQRAFDVFDRNLEASRLPEPPVELEAESELEPEPELVVFIGHGRNPAWRDLKDHLHEKHGIEVEAYEIGARAGHTIRDILEEMLERSSFAVLVMTGEDETVDGDRRARQNVIHEAGLFQGRLGFNRAIVLLEEGTEAFSNIQGIERIHFAPGKIRETFGDVLATLRREFGNID